MLYGNVKHAANSYRGRRHNSKVNINAPLSVFQATSMMHTFRFKGTTDRRATSDEGAVISVLSLVFLIYSSHSLQREHRIQGSRIITVHAHAFGAPFGSCVIVSAYVMTCSEAVMR